MPFLTKQSSAQTYKGEEKIKIFKKEPYASIQTIEISSAKFQNDWLKSVWCAASERRW